MPRKIRELKADLRRAGFGELRRRGKGSHGVWVHSTMAGAQVTLAGGDNADAHPYQERQVQAEIEKTKSAPGG